MKNYNNKISVSIEEKDLKEILDAINFIDEKLSELVTLSKEEVMALPRMQEDTILFVSRSLESAYKNINAVPKNVELDEVKKDLELCKSIEKISTPLNAIMKKLSDSALLASSEAYLPAIAIHNALSSRGHQKRSGALH